MISAIAWYIMEGRSVPPGRSLIVTSAACLISVPKTGYGLPADISVENERWPV